MRGHEVVGLVSPDGCWQARGEIDGRAPALRFVPRTVRDDAPAGELPGGDEDSEPNSGPPLEADGGSEGSAVRALRSRPEDDRSKPRELFFEDPCAPEDAAPTPLAGSVFELARRLDVDSIAVSLEDRRGVQPTDDLLRCRLEGMIVEEGEALFERVSGKIAVEAMRPSYLIFNKGFVQSPAAEFGKRALDIISGVVGLILAAPLMIATAIVVRLDSAGPVLFRQERCGRNGSPFTLLKFRSMRADAEKASGPVWATANDPRITRVGRFSAQDTTR